MALSYDNLTLRYCLNKNQCVIIELFSLGNIVKAITDLEIHQLLLKYWFTLLHFAMDHPVAQNFNEGSLTH